MAAFELDENGLLRKVKLKDGLKATELLARNLGLLKEQISIEGGSEELSAFERERIKEFTDDELRVFTEAANTVERMLHGPGAVK